MLADQVKSCGFPVFLRPGSEVGPYGYNENKKQTSREYFAKSFRHIVNIFRERKVDNVAFVWCTVGVESYDYWLDYYAGDDYVDWWGINFFGEKQIKGCERYMEEARKRNKPVIICESAPAFEGGTVSGTSIERFFKPFFGMFNEYGHIKAFVYINIDWSADTVSPFSHWPDSRIQSNPEVLSYYKAALSDSRFIHLKDIQEPEGLRRLLGIRQTGE